MTSTEQFFAALFEPGDIVELRAFGVKQFKDAKFSATYAGHFDDLTELARRAEKLGSNPLCPGVYFSLNPLRKASLPLNDLTWKARNTTKDADIRERQTILIDIDPVRKGVNSTDAQVAAVRLLARTVRQALTDMGWPLPIATFSGNGFHLFYRCDNIPTDRIEALLHAIAAKHSTPKIKIDEVVFNDARIARVVNTWNRKCESLPDSPQRLARVVNIPSTLTRVSLEQVDAAITAWGAPIVPSARARRSKSPRKAPAENLLEQLLDMYPEVLNWHPSNIRHDSDGTYYGLDTCPSMLINDDSHQNQTDRKTEFSYKNGVYGYHCFSSRCQGVGFFDIVRLCEEVTGIPCRLEFYPLTDESAAALDAAQCAEFASILETRPKLADVIDFDTYTPPADRVNRGWIKIPDHIQNPAPKELAEELSISFPPPTPPPPTPPPPTRIPLTVAELCARIGGTIVPQPAPAATPSTPPAPQPLTPPEPAGRWVPYSGVLQEYSQCGPGYWVAPGPERPMTNLLGALAEMHYADMAEAELAQA